jgi:hypothetical protein
MKRNLPTGADKINSLEDWRNGSDTENSGDHLNRGVAEGKAPAQLSGSESYYRSLRQHRRGGGTLSS